MLTIRGSLTEAATNCKHLMAAFLAKFGLEKVFQEFVETAIFMRLRPGDYMLEFCANAEVVHSKVVFTDQQKFVFYVR